MFKSFRQIGCVSTGTPFTILQSGSKRLVIVSIGHSWQAYDCDNLRIVFIGPKFKKKIRGLACDGSVIFAAVKGGIEVCRRVEHIASKALPSNQSLLQLLRLGPVLICLFQRSISIWKTNNLDHLVNTFHFEEDFKASCMTHLDTYVNKILVGSESGVLQLWNFMTGEKLFTFLELSPAGVCCLEPAPALDVVGVGLSNGSILLLNVRCNEVLFKLEMSSSKLSTSCKSLAFTTGLNTALLASGGSHGEVLIWDLEEKQLLCKRKDTHSDSLASLCFFPSSLVLMSCSEDNSLKQWNFDLLSNELRILRQRCGPQTSPSLLKFLPDGLNLLLCDKQSALWNISTIQDQQTRQLSSKKTIVRSRTLDLDSCWVRERDWGNILTIHDGQRSPFLWNLRKFSLEKSSFLVASTIGKKLCLQPTAVAFSQCGNFGFVGYHCGSLHKFNLQSGLHRGHYSIENKQTAHHSKIVGLATDQLNQRVLSTGIDGVLKIWNFKSRILISELDLKSPVAGMTIHSPSSLLALALDNLSVQIYDYESEKIVRRFHSVKDRMTWIQISIDGRWLLVSSMDRALRIFDIPSANQIQVLFFKQPVVSFSLSASLEVLATAHLNSRGVSLWVNQFVLRADDLSIQSEGQHGPVLDPEMETRRKLMRLALTPVSNWSIDYNSTIKEKTEAVKPAKQRPPVPFFLPPLISGNAPDWWKTVGQENKKQDEMQGVEKSYVGSEFLTQLQLFKKEKNRKDFLEFMKKQTVVYIEQEMISLTREISLDSEEQIGEEELEDFKILLDFIELMVDSQEDIEFVQMLLKMVLHLKSSLFISVESLCKRLEKIQEKMDVQWKKLEGLLEATQCMVSLFIGLHE